MVGGRWQLLPFLFPHLLHPSLLPPCHPWPSLPTYLMPTTNSRSLLSSSPIPCFFPTLLCATFHGFKYYTMIRAMPFQDFFFDLELSFFVWGWIRGCRWVRSIVVSSFSWWCHFPHLVFVAALTCALRYDGSAWCGGSACASQTWRIHCLLRLAFMVFDVWMSVNL